MAVPNITFSAQGSATFTAHFSQPPPITRGQAPRAGGSISRCSLSPQQPCSIFAWWSHSRITAPAASHHRASLPRLPHQGCVCVLRLTPCFLFGHSCMFVQEEATSLCHIIDDFCLRLTFCFINALFRKKGLFREVNHCFVGFPAYAVLWLPCPVAASPDLPISQSKLIHR